MNSAIEQGLRNFLLEELEADELEITPDPPLSVMAATISGVSVAIHANTGADTLSEALARIVIQAEVKHEVGPLHMAAITALVSTPAQVGSYDDTKHRAIVAALRTALFAVDNQAAISAALTAAAGCSATGFYVEEFTDAIAGDRWQTKIRYKLGLHEG